MYNNHIKRANHSIYSVQSTVFLFNQFFVCVCVCVCVEPKWFVWLKYENKKKKRKKRENEGTDK